MTDTNRLQDWIHAIAVSPGFIQDGTAFAALQSGLFTTNDSGKTWKSTYHLTAKELGSQTVYPTATTVCLSPGFTQDHCLWSAVHGAIIRSQESGLSWQFSRLGPPEPVITCLAVSPNFSRDQTLFAGSLEDGLYISSDSGVSWFPWNFGLIESNIQSIAVSPSFQRDELAFAAAGGSLYRSQNSGRSWKPLKFPVEDIQFNCLALSPQFERDGTLFAGAEQGLFTSDKQGDKWTRLGTGIIDGSVDTILIGQDNHPLLVVLADNAPYYSLDLGQAWDKLDVNLSGKASIQALALTGASPAHFSLLAGLSSGRIIPLTHNF